MANIPIRLRELERADLPKLNAWRNDPSLIALLGGTFRHVCLAVDDAWYDRYLAARQNNVRLAITLDDGSLVGAIYLLNIDWQNRNADLGMWIGEPSARGRGVGTAALRAMLQHAFGDLNLERVQLGVLSDNGPAIALYQKCGFVKEGLFRRAVFKEGRWCDLTRMAILREEFLPDGARRE
jgi:RimJ/RimL family protein N-acetyltransferase